MPSSCELCGGPLGDLLENALKYGAEYTLFYVDTGGCAHCWGERKYGKERKDAPTQGVPSIPGT